MSTDRTPVSVSRDGACKRALEERQVLARITAFASLCTGLNALSQLLKLAWAIGHGCLR